MNIRTPLLNINSPALKYWMNELANKSDQTREIYLKNFIKFAEFTGKTPDELLEQRQEDQMNNDPKTQRQIESQLIKFIASEREKGLAPATLQTYFASIRSFFETHYYPLRMRRGDYPTGESIGVKIAPKEAILKALENKATRHKALTNALILLIKDSGLRASDVRLLNYGHISKGLESGDKIIPITLITKKAKIVAKTFIGEEAIQALNIYLKARRNGTRYLPPEEITKETPLFRTWSTKTIRRIPRTTLSNTVRNAFLRISQPNMSPHSLRKYLQTNLEVAGVNTNWIDQILGHKLINSRDAYSKPTDEQLQNAYTNAYKFLRVYPNPTVQPETQPTKTEESTNTEEYVTATASTLQQVLELINHGYRLEMEMDGLKIFRKRK